MPDWPENQRSRTEAGCIPIEEHLRFPRRAGASAHHKTTSAMKTNLSACVLALVLSVLGTTAVTAQQVTGRVVNAETLQPLSGVLVSVEDASTAALTNAEGRYTIQAAGEATLRFSVLGYAPQSVDVAARSEVNVALVPTALALEGLVVVGYGIQQRASLTGSVSSVSSEELTRTSGTVTTEGLVGKTPGLTSRIAADGGSDARPGSSTIIQIRNLGSPLIVIDGVPQEYSSGTDRPGTPNRYGNAPVNPLDNLNPADIESISVLKDASASVYGFRAANGVILVTTKSGARSQAPRLTMDGYYGIQNMTRFPFDPPANAYEYKRAWLDSEQNRRQTRTISPEELELWRIGAPGTPYESFNQTDVVINNPNAEQYQFNTSLSGGSDRASYYISMGRVSQDYVMKEHTFNRTNLHANVQADLTNRWSAGLQLSGNLENRDNVAIPGRDDVVFNAMLGVNSSWPMDNPYANSNPEYINGDVRFLTRLGSTYTRANAGFQEDRRRLGTAKLTTAYEFPFGLRAQATYSQSIRQNLFDRQRFSYDAYCYDAATDTYNVCNGFRAAQRDKERRDVEEKFGGVQLSQSVQLGSHSLSGVLAAEATGYDSDLTAIRSVPPSNFTRLVSFVEQNALENQWSRTARQSAIGRFNYDYAQKYLFEALGRYDGSYLYADDNRWGFFPGVSVAWRLTEEPMLRDRFAFLDELKLRASWGQTGREQGVAPWGFLGGATYGVGQGAVFDGQAITGVRPRGLPVTNLSWVTATSRNLGVDFVVFNKIDGQFDVFERKLSGLPAARYDVLLPNEVGYLLPNENLESEANRGLEGRLTFQDVVGRGDYFISVHGTVARQKLLDRYKPRYGNSWDQYRNGQENRWDDVDFSYEVVGRFQTVEEIENWPINNDLQGNRTMLPGDLIFKDVNGDGIIDPLDQRPRGFGNNQLPIVMYGFNGGGQYGGVSLSIDFSGGAMYSFRQNVESKLPFQGGHNSQQWMFVDRWHRADPYDDQSEWIPGKWPPIRRAEGSHNNYSGSRGGNSDFYRTNVKYLRLKRVEVGYSLASSLTSRLGIDGARVYTSVANPLTFDNVKHLAMDPEMAATAALRYPTQRVINVGFNWTFGGGGPAPGVPIAAND